MAGFKVFFLFLESSKNNTDSRLFKAPRVSIEIASSPKYVRGTLVQLSARPVKKSSERGSHCRSFLRTCSLALADKREQADSQPPLRLGFRSKAMAPGTVKKKSAFALAASAGLLPVATAQFGFEIPQEFFGGGGFPGQVSCQKSFRLPLKLREGGGSSSRLFAAISLLDGI